MALLFDTISRFTIFASSLLVFGSYLAYRLVRWQYVPQLGLPVVGKRENEWFSGVRAAWRNSWDSKTMGWTAWYQYGAKGKVCVFPVIVGADLVLLPHSDLPWMVEQPDSSLGNREEVAESWLLGYTFMNPGVTDNPIHEKLLSGKFTGQLGNLVPDLMATIGETITRNLGVDEWREVPIQSTVRMLAGMSINRALLGKQIGSDQRIQNSGLAFSLDMMVSVAVLQLVWRPLRSLAAILVTLPNRYHSYMFHRIVRPGIIRRLEEYESRRIPMENKSIQEPNDMLELLIHQAKQLNGPWFCQPETLAARILILNFAALFTTTFAMTNAILDLTSHGMRYFDELRAEIQEVLAAHGGEWNKHTLADLVKLDSFMRESQRMNSLVTMAIRRTVVGPDGVTTPSGVHVPQGHTVATYILPISFDPTIYADPYEFKPFRFATNHAGANGAPPSGQAWASTSTTYLPWGHGRHACPGRFFASTSIKLHLAYLIMHYDFEMIPERPENQWFTLAQMPPRNAIMKVRRRSGW